MGVAVRYSGTEDKGAGGIQFNPPNQATQKHLQETLEKIDEVNIIMRDNVQKILERDDKLSELVNRADVLEQWASQFKEQTGKLKRKHRWKNLKVKIIMGTIALLLIAILIVWATSGASRNKPVAPVNHAPTTQNPPSQQPERSIIQTSYQLLR
jgi:hypothetical protein